MTTDTAVAGQTENKRIMLERDWGPEPSGGYIDGKTGHVMLDHEGWADEDSDDESDTDLTALFARLPDNLVLDVSARDLQLRNGAACLVAWIARDQIIDAMNGGADPDGFHDASLLDHDMAPNDYLEVAKRQIRDEDEAKGEWTDPCAYHVAAKLFGGLQRDWQRVFQGVVEDEDLPVIEIAWADRVMAAALPKRRPRRRRTAAK